MYYVSIYIGQYIAIYIKDLINSVMKNNSDSYLSFEMSTILVYH